MTEIGVLPPEEMRELWQWYKSQRALPAYLTRHEKRHIVEEFRPRRVQCQLTSNLAAATNRWTSPSTATATVYWKLNDGVEMADSGRSITIVNRFEDISLPSGAYCKAEWIDGEWQLYVEATSRIRVGIVRARVDAQFYEIELGDLPRSAFGNHDLECIACNPCSEVFGAGTEDCGLSITDPDSIVVTDGELITAYDPFSDKIPLKVGTDCVVAKASGLGARYGNYGGYGDGNTWVVLNGYHEHLVQYREEWDCCDPTGPPTLIRKTPVILIGTECDPIECGACP